MWMKKYNIRVTGNAEEDHVESDQTTDLIVDTINRKIHGFKLRTSDIDISRRLVNGKSRPIIVKLMSRTKRNYILKNRKSFKGSNIYIKEDLALSTKSIHIQTAKQIALFRYFDNNKHSSIINNIITIMKYLMFAMKCRARNPHCVAFKTPPNSENKN